MTQTTDTQRPTSKPYILAQAVNLAKEKGLRGFSRRQVANAAQVAPATVSYHFEDMEELRREVVRHAIEHEVISVLADARADRKSSDLFTRMSADLKQKVAAFIAR